MRIANKENRAFKRTVQDGFLPRNTNTNNASGMLYEYFRLYPNKMSKPKADFFKSVLQSVVSHMRKFDVTTQSERIHAIYAAFDVSRAVAYNTDIVSEYLRRVNKLMKEVEADEVTEEEIRVLKEYMNTKPLNNKDAAKASIYRFLSSLKQNNINNGRTCNLQSLFVPAIGFAIGKYFGTCMDNMLVDFYTQQSSVPNMEGSHFQVVNKSSNNNTRAKEEIFLKLVFPGLFRHIFCSNNSVNHNRNCANASELVWLLESVMKRTSLLPADKERLRAYLILRTKKPLAKRQRRR